MSCRRWCDCVARLCAVFASVLVATLCLSGCSDDDPPAPSPNEIRLINFHSEGVVREMNRAIDTGKLGSGVPLSTTESDVLNWLRTPEVANAGSVHFGVLSVESLDDQHSLFHLVVFIGIGSADPWHIPRQDPDAPAEARTCINIPVTLGTHAHADAFTRVACPPDTPTYSQQELPDGTRIPRYPGL